MIIIPLGEECITCQSIDPKFSNNNMRNCAFPFDYVAGSGLKQIYNNLYNLLINNEGPLTELDFTTIQVPHVDNKYYFISKKYGYIYWHDIGSTDNIFSSNDINDFISKYNRRYERLINIIKTSNDISFFSVDIFENTYNTEKIDKKEDVLKLYNFLYEINNNIKFYAINYTEENSIHNTLHFVNLNVNRELPFMESKLLYVKNLADFANVNFSSETTSI